MPADISAGVAYIGGVWCEGVLYGIHLLVFGIVCNTLLRKSYISGREVMSRILLLFSTFLFILSTAHVALALHQLLQGFIYHVSEGGPQSFFRDNVFPKRKAIYIINTLLGDLFLIWRVYVIWRNKRVVCALPALLLLGTIICGVKTIISNGRASGHSSVFTSNIKPWITSTFVLNIATQMTSTTLLACRIYRVSRLSSTGSQRGFYRFLMWLIIESGAIYTSAVLVQMITYLLKMNAGVILESICTQLSAIAPALIVVRIGLRSTHAENQGSQEDVVLTTLHDTIPPSASGGKNVNDAFRPNVLSNGSFPA